MYTCYICQIQYIGETKNSLKERANAHRSQIMCEDSNHPLYKHLVSNPISHSIDTSITHDDTHFTLTPIELIKDSGEPLLNTFERLKRESYWMVLIGTVKPVTRGHLKKCPYMTGVPSSQVHFNVKVYFGSQKMQFRHPNLDILVSPRHRFYCTIKPYGLNTLEISTTIQENFAICGPIL